MKNHLNRFLIVKFGSLGDIVHCLPSVAQLRAAFPRAEIDWLIERKNKIAVEMSGLDVKLIPIDTYQWRNSPGIGSAKEIGEFVWALRTDGYDCAIDFQGLLKSAFFAYLSGAPVRRKAYWCVSCFNRKHMIWAWMSLFWVAFSDIYIRLCSTGVWHDWRII